MFIILAKQKRKAEEEEERQRRGEKRKRKTNRKQPQNYTASTAGTSVYRDHLRSWNLIYFLIPLGEAIGKMLVGKRISNKIDYEKLKDLSFIFGPTTSSSNPLSETPVASDPKVEPSTPVAPSRSR